MLCFGSRRKHDPARHQQKQHQPAARGGLLRFERATRYDFRAGVPFASVLRGDAAAAASSSKNGKARDGAGSSASSASSTSSASSDRKSR